jgi:hypothetical protein
MVAQVVMAIAILMAVSFFIYMLFTKEQANSAYVKFILFAYPFVSIDILPSILSFNLFDFPSLSSEYEQITIKFKQRLVIKASYSHRFP